MMKNTKLVSLFSVVLLALTGCKQTCSKEQFVELAKKTEPHQYTFAKAKVKGKVTASTGGVKQTYEPDTTFEFIFNKNGYWGYDGDSNYSSGDVKGSVISSCIVLLSVTVKDLINQDEFLGENDAAGKLTCYSSPLGFNLYDTDAHDKRILLAFCFSRGHSLVRSTSIPELLIVRIVYFIL